jgi:hypothetical protein
MSISNTKQHYNTGRSWKEMDEEFIRMVFSGSTTTDCAIHFERSENSIEFRKLLHARGLIDNGKTIEEAAELMQISIKSIEDYIDGFKDHHNVNVSDDEREKSIRDVQDDKYINGKIYDLIHDGNIIYRGSTYQALNARLRSHRTSKYHGKLSEYVMKNGPKNIQIRLVEPFPCKSRKELEDREKVLIRELNNNSNCLNIQNRYDSLLILRILSDPSTIINRRPPPILRRTPGGILWTSEVKSNV